jgi:hypothetical protein
VQLTPPHPHPHPPPPPAATAIPWERRRELGIVRAFRDTLVLSIREPTRFYGLIPTEGSIWPALAYGLVFDLIVAAFGFAYSQTLGATEFASSITPMLPQLREVLPEGPELMAKVMTGSAIGSFLMTPISYLFNLTVTTLMAWVGLRLARGLSTSFGRLQRLFAYASWIQIFGLLAITGDVILSTLSFLLVLGFGSYYWLVIVRESQRVDTKRAALASLYGCLVAFAFACFLGVPVVIGLGWLLVSKLGL